MKQEAAVIVVIFLPSHNWHDISEPYIPTMSIKETDHNIIMIMTF
jgi:hypothetical protein